MPSTTESEDSIDAEKPANQKYHLIIVGMQEAAFTTKTKKVSDANITVGELDTSRKSVGAADNEAVYKKKSKIQRKWDKVGLMLRGLTVQQTHRT